MGLYFTKPGSNQANARKLLGGGRSGETEIRWTAWWVDLRKYPTLPRRALPAEVSQPRCSSVAGSQTVWSQDPLTFLKFTEGPQKAFVPMSYSCWCLSYEKSKLRNLKNTNPFKKSVISPYVLI